MPTFGQWELDVLEHTYEYIDYISLHKYYGNLSDNTADYLGRSVHMDAFIKSVAAICDTVKGKKHSKKIVNLSFDEWNVWYHSNNTKRPEWQVAPPILEDIYNFEDALLVGSMLMTLQNNCDRVKIACLAQLVNVIAPIMTENNGSAWVQTIYYPYMYASRYGRGVTLKTVNNCETYKTSDDFEVPYVDTSVILNEEKKEIVVFAINRSLEEEMELNLNFEGFNSVEISEHIELYADDLKAINTKDNKGVAPQSVSISKEKASQHNIKLKKHSWNMLKFSY
jgi:alpha-N-arabinofuranosidase